MEVYSVPVLFTMWALTAQIRKNRQADIIVLAVCALVIALISGLRWYADVDYDLYVEMYNDNPLLGDFNMDSISGLYGEPGYLFLTSLFKSAGINFTLLFLTLAVCSLLLKSLVASRLSQQASFALCLYLCLHFVTIEFIQMRWAVATGFLALGFYFQYLRSHKAAILCYALAPVLHYFAVLFWIVAVLITMKGYRRFYLLFVVSLLGALFLKIDYLGQFLISDTDIYVLQRLTRYAANPESHIGLFSYGKLLMYPVIYVGCVWWRPSLPWKTDRLNLFLFRLSLVSLSATLFVTFLPILHFRATVIADFFAIFWILNALDQALSVGARTFAFISLAVLYCTWYIIDVSNYVAAGRLYEYHTWLTMLE